MTRQVGMEKDDIYRIDKPGGEEKGRSFPVAT